MSKHINEIDNDLRKLKNEANAAELRRYFDTHAQRAQVENICNGRAHWNACGCIHLVELKKGE